LDGYVTLAGCPTFDTMSNRGSLFSLAHLWSLGELEKSHSLPDWDDGIILPLRQEAMEINSFDPNLPEGESVS